MRDYGKVYASFWTSETIRSMSEDARNLALYLLTCPHNTIAGVFRLPDGYVCDDLQWSKERVSKAFAETLSKGFATRCETTKWVVINNHFEWNPPENPNQRKSAAKIILSIPEQCQWKPEFIRHCEESGLIEFKPFRNPSETLSQPVTVTVTGTVTEINPIAHPSADAEEAGIVYTKAFTAFWEMYPVKKSKGDAFKAFNKIKAVEYPAVKSGLLRAIDSADWKKDNGQFIKHPGAWLRARGWEDEYAGSAKDSSKPFNMDEFLKGIQA